jgi:hypothetical protein
MFVLNCFILFRFQLPEHLGSVRTISQGKGSQLLLGSTRNSILQGTFELNFQEIVTGHVDEVKLLRSFLSIGYPVLIFLAQETILFLNFF